MSIILNGIGVSRGIAIGNAYVYVRATTEAKEYNVPARYHDTEIRRLRQAVRDASAILIGAGAGMGVDSGSCCRGADLLAKFGGYS